MKKTLFRIIVSLNATHAYISPNNVEERLSNKKLVTDKLYERDRFLLFDRLILNFTDCVLFLTVTF